LSFKKIWFWIYEGRTIGDHNDECKGYGQI